MKTVQSFLLFIVLFTVDAFPQDAIAAAGTDLLTAIPVPTSLKPEVLTKTNLNEVNDEEIPALTLQQDGNSILEAIEEEASPPAPKDDQTQSNSTSLLERTTKSIWQTIQTIVQSQDTILHLTEPTKESARLSPCLCNCGIGSIPCSNSVKSEQIAKDDSSILSSTERPFTTQSDGETENSIDSSIPAEILPKSNQIEAAEDSIASEEAPKRPIGVSVEFGIKDVTTEAPKVDSARVTVENGIQEVPAARAASLDLEIKKDVTTEAPKTLKTILETTADTATKSPELETKENALEANEAAETNAISQSEAPKVLKTILEAAPDTATKSPELETKINSAEANEAPKVLEIDAELEVTEANVTSQAKAEVPKTLKTILEAAPDVVAIFAESETKKDALEANEAQKEAGLAVDAIPHAGDEMKVSEESIKPRTLDVRTESEDPKETEPLAVVAEAAAATQTEKVSQTNEDSTRSLTIDAKLDVSNFANEASASSLPVAESEVSRSLDGVASSETSTNEASASDPPASESEVGRSLDAVESSDISINEASARTPLASESLDTVVRSEITTNEDLATSSPAGESNIGRSVDAVARSEISTNEVSATSSPAGESNIGRSLDAVARSEISTNEASATSSPAGESNIGQSLDAVARSEISSNEASASSQPAGESDIGRSLDGVAKPEMSPEIRSDTANKSSSSFETDTKPITAAGGEVDLVPEAATKSETSETPEAAILRKVARGITEGNQVPTELTSNRPEGVPVLNLVTATGIVTATDAPKLSTLPKEVPTPTARPDTRKVDAIETSSTPSIPCTEVGNFSNPTNCRLYITCSGNATELVRQEHECPERSAYSSVLRRCTRDISPCGAMYPTCWQSGSIADPKNPSAYYWCVRSSSISFHKYHVHCSSNEAFNGLIGRCWPQDLVFGPRNQVNDILTDHDVVKAEWKQLKKQMKTKAKEEKIRRKMEAKSKALAEKLAAKAAQKKQKGHSNKDEDDDDEDDDEY